MGAMDEPFTLRPARPSDLPGIVAIYNFYVERTAATFEVRPVTPEERRTWFEGHTGRGPHRLMVAVDGANAVRAWASTSEFRPRAAYRTTVESSVYCREDSRGIGLGARLYGALFRAIEAEDLERIVAGVAQPNPASMALHRRLGFREVGTFTRVGRKFGRYWDVTWLERAHRLAPSAAPRERRHGTVAPSTGGRRPRRAAKRRRA
jgi:phosphinothricin acetyltransferase